MSNIAFTSQLDWPNGRGYTPCTHEYADIVDEMNTIKPDYVSMDDLSSEDYEKWNHLDNKRAEMQMSGKHIGKSVRY